jgi:hypothetical protein
MILTSKTAFALLVTSLMLVSSAVAQLKVNYHFGFIGATGDTSVKLSEPVMIDYSKCFDVSNGLSRFNPPKSGLFAISCAEEALPKINLLVNAYPNPVINQLTVKSLTYYPEKGVSKYSIVITDIRGNPVRELKTDLLNINRGVTVSVNDLPMGYFILTLYADKERIQSFKILKA